MPDSIVAEPVIFQVISPLPFRILLNKSARLSEYSSVNVSGIVTDFFGKNAGLPLGGISSYDIMSVPTGAPSADSSYSIFDVVKV